MSSYEDLPLIKTKHKSVIFRAFKPWVMVWEDIKEIAKPYRTIRDMVKDFAQPLYGLANIGLGLGLLAINPLLAPIQDVFDMKMARLSYVERLLFNLARGTTIVTQGIFQVVTTPLTWLVKFPIRAFVVTPGVKLKTLYTAYRADKLKEQLLPENIQESSVIKVKDQALDTYSLSHIISFLDLKERANISTVNKQCYKAVTQIKDPEENIYYLVGNASVRTSSRKYLYGNRKEIPATEVKACYLQNPKITTGMFAEEVKLFKTKAEARFYALSKAKDGIANYQYIPPIFKVQFSGASNLNFKEEAVTINKGTISSCSERCEKTQVIAYSSCSRDKVRIISGTVVTSFPDINYEYSADKQKYIRNNS